MTLGAKHPLPMVRTDPLPVTLGDVESAQRVFQGRVRRTPLLECGPLGFWVKAECLQLCGAFKIRGALNRLAAIPSKQRGAGVVTWSSGNHAQGVALAGRLLEIPVTVVMPADALAHKVEATRALGAQVVQEGVTQTNREAMARFIARQTGAVAVPSFDDPWIVAGQGTVALEILSQLPDVDAIVAPLGGGGLLAGIVVAARAMRPEVKLYGVEPAAGNDGQRSLQEGRRIRIEPPDTIADGARTLSLGELNFEIIRRGVDGIVTVPDDALLEAIWALARHARLVVEPTGALAAAALLSGALQPSGKTCVVLSGGNISAEMLARAAERGRVQRP